jgi:beta-galactosidase
LGRKGGKIVYTEEIHTTGAPAAIRLTVDRNMISADQRDVAHVKVEVVDENGYVIPTANELVQLKVEGAGTLIGFDNGNPSDHTSMKSSQRRTFNGLALAVIQGSDKTGKIRVEAIAPSIKGATVEINTQQPAIRF